MARSSRRRVKRQMIEYVFYGYDLRTVRDKHGRLGRRWCKTWVVPIDALNDGEAKKIVETTKFRYWDWPEGVFRTLSDLVARGRLVCFRRARSGTMRKMKTIAWYDWLK